MPNVSIFQLFWSSLGDYLRHKFRDALVQAGGALADFPAVAVAIYGRERYERLASIKKTYDPANMCRLNHNVIPAGQAPLLRSPGCAVKSTVAFKRTKK
jgi:hypothetical protein